MFHAPVQTSWDGPLSRMSKTKTTAHIDTVSPENTHDQVKTSISLMGLDGLVDISWVTVQPDLVKVAQLSVKSRV